MPPKKTKSPNTVTPAAVAKGKKQLSKAVSEPEPEKKVVAKTAPQKEEKKVEVKPEAATKSTAKSGSVKSEPKFIATGDFQGALGDGKFNKDKVLVASWNINGIRAVQKKGELEAYINSVQPDVLCLNESKIDSETFKNDPSIGKMIPSDYQQFWNFCKPPKKGYAGSAIFSKVAPISVTYDIGVKKHDQEGRTITVEFQTFYVVVCYVPNAGQGLDRLGYRTKEWDIDFQAYLNGLKAKKHVVLCGDLNVCHEEIDIAKPKGNEKSAGFTKEERAGFTNFLSQGWTDSFRKKYPTKVQYSYWNLRSGARKINQGWRLDYFVIDDDLYNHVIDSSINNDIFGSDHCPIELTLNNKTLKS